MRRNVAALLIGLGATALVAGCFPAPVVIEIEKGGDDIILDAKVGDTIRLTLDANPTTGYQWGLVGLDTAVLENTDYEYVPDEAAPGVAGTGGHDIWEFTVRGTGSAVLRLEYRQPWAPPADPPADTFEMTVRVTG
jgi:inhibitor of cysteine peptidase